MRKIYVEARVKLIIVADEGEELDDILCNMDYDFSASDSNDADIVDTEIMGWEVLDSK